MSPRQLEPLYIDSRKERRPEDTETTCRMYSPEFEPTCPGMALGNIGTSLVKDTHVEERFDAGRQSCKNGWAR